MTKLSSSSVLPFRSQARQCTSGLSKVLYTQLGVSSSLGACACIHVTKSVSCNHACDCQIVEWAILRFFIVQVTVLYHQLAISNRIPLLIIPSRYCVILVSRPVCQIELVLFSLVDIEIRLWIQ